MSCSRYSNDAASGGMVKQVQVVVAVVAVAAVVAAVVVRRSLEMQRLWERNVVVPLLPVKAQLRQSGWKTSLLVGG